MPPSDETHVSIPAGAPADEVQAVVDAGLRVEDARRAREEGRKLIGKGPDQARFVVVRAGDRHGVHYRPEQFHVVVGAGVRLPAGAMLVSRDWGMAANLDGRNEQVETLGLGVVVEPGAPRPFPQEVVDAVGTFCAAVARRAPLHPDCVLAMADVPYMRPFDGADAERALAAAARRFVPVPEPDGTLRIETGSDSIDVEDELRDTDAGIQTGMMLRRQFDGENRGMLFRYPHAFPRRYWNRNVFIPIDLAYVSPKGRIEQLLTMKPEAGTPPEEIPLYESVAAVDTVLEMPSGWYDAHGVKVGDRLVLPEGH